ncbi:MAG: hypothetical protein L6311_16295 [Cellulomonas sp.]|nr:hypothetical protein [Cellulomonas sp.]
MARRLPARVYLVRRIVVLVALALVVTVVVLLVRAIGGGGSDAAPPPPTVTTTAPPDIPTAPTSPTSTLPGGVTDCAAGDLALTAVAAAPSFGAEVSPTFTLTITNNGATSCLVDAGDGYRSIVVTSGTDRVWSNQDCAAPDADRRTLLLAPGMTDTTTLVWNRERSAPGCAAGLPKPGDGTYVATFSVGGAQAAPAAFVLG